MRETTLTDEHGRRVTFLGELLVHEHTDVAHRVKPQWLEIKVWRTQAGEFVAQRVTHYRISHSDPDCPRAEGYLLTEATSEQTYPCDTCGSGPYALADRETVSRYPTPESLIRGFEARGRHTQLSRVILADLSDLDDRVNNLWNDVRIP